MTTPCSGEEQGMSPGDAPAAVNYQLVPAELHQSLAPNDAVSGLPGLAVLSALHSMCLASES